MAPLSPARSGAGADPVGKRYVRRGRPGYPSRLEHLFRPPGGIWVRGPGDPCQLRMIAIVGTRRATDYGRRMAHDLAFDLAGLGWTIVSGLATGIDAAAHRGALAAEGGTIGVLGCGIDRVYPASNRHLYEALARRGLLLSEFPPDERPTRLSFPRRNRIIAALSQAVVVVQAGERSGALITADHALDLGREVLAVPGAADQPASRGSNRLLRDGAGVVETAGHILEALGLANGDPEARMLQPDLFAAATPMPAGAPADRLRFHLAAGPAPLEDLARRSALSVPEALAALSEMELGGVVTTLPGHRFELVGKR